jgi:hypothetical protein
MVWIYDPAQPWTAGKVVRIGNGGGLGWWDTK